MDFEISFYENLLKRKPDFVDALAAIGNLYTKKGLYEKGLKADLKLSMIKPDDPIVLYNLACSYSLLKDMDKALETIQKAIESGYDHFDYLLDDSDLINLRADKRFQEYYSRLRKHKAFG